MNKIEPKTIDLIIAKMKKMLNEKELGVKISFGNAKYDSDSFKVQCQVSLPNAKSEEEKWLDSHIQMRNANKKYYRPLDISKIVQMGNNKYTLFGYKPKSHKKPFIILNLDNNKKYIITEENCEKYFGDKDWKDTSLDYEIPNYKPRTQEQTKAN